MSESVYHIRVYYNRDSWCDGKPDRKFGTYAESVEAAEEKFWNVWPFDVEDVRYDGNTIHVWSPDC
jgi:hypothetical protein